MRLKYAFVRRKLQLFGILSGLILNHFVNSWQVFVITEPVSVLFHIPQIFYQ